VKPESQKYKEVTDALAERGNKVREKVKNVLLSGVTDPRLLEIMTKAGASWQDVFRPGLTSLCCEVVGGQAEAAVDAGVMFTLASMGFGVHDDIIDKSKFKRFRSTILGKYGLESALLVGDLFIVKGWTALGYLIEKKYSLEKITQIINVYGDLNVQICEAELVDALNRRKLDVSVEEHMAVLWKAMAEVETLTRIGAILGNATQTEVEALAAYGRYLGVNLRLFDEVKDCLNVEGGLVQRLKNESVPLPILFSAHSSQERFTKIEAIVKKRVLSPFDLQVVLGSCFDSDAFSNVMELARVNKEKALVCLDKLKPSSSKVIIGLLVERSCEEIEALFS
jgi:geranylgeranyl pyrophosphate synthase